MRRWTEESPFVRVSCEEEEEEKGVERGKERSWASSVATK